jgi:hypothetical protein
VIVAMAVFLAFALPHAIFHLAHPAEALNSREDALNAASLWAEAAVSAAIFVTAFRVRRAPG